MWESGDHLPTNIPVKCKWKCTFYVEKLFCDFQVQWLCACLNWDFSDLHHRSMLFSAAVSGFKCLASGWKFFVHWPDQSHH